MRYYSLFSGIEAASVAWMPLGFEPLAFSEIDPYCCELLRQRFPDVPNVGDITQVDWREVAGRYGKPDIIVGGSPCQSFSVAGKREGLSGSSGLMYEYVRAIQDVMPEWVVWENVPGALSSDHGEAFGCLLRELDAIGYGVAWRVLDAQFARVPVRGDNGEIVGWVGPVAQRRERVFLVGHLGDGRAAEVLFEPDCLRWDPPSSKAKRQELARAAGKGDRGIHASTLKLRHTGSPMPDGKSGGIGPLVQDDMSATLGTSNDQTKIATDDNCLTPWDAQSRRVYTGDGTWPTLYGGEGGGRGYVITECTGFRPNQSEQARSFAANEDLSPTCVGNYHNPAVILNEGTGGVPMPTLTRRMHKDPPVIVESDERWDG